MNSVFTLLSLVALTLAHPHGKRAAMATVYSDCKESNAVAFTFDDGPWIYEKNVSDTLTKYGAKGTFFVNGDNYECIYDDAMVANVKATYAAGHQFGSHTWQHQDLTTISFDNIHDQMWRTEQALQKILGVSPAFMRPPYGNYNNLVRQVAAQRNQSLVLWDFDSGDSTGSTVQQSESAYTAELNKKPKNLLPLNHETYNTTAYQLLPWALQQFKNKGYKMVTVAECLGMQPYKAEGTTYKPGKKDGSWACGPTNSVVPGVKQPTTNS